MTELLNDTALWGLLVGVLTPLLTAVVQRPGWTRTTRTIIGYATSVVLGAVTVLAAGGVGDGPVTVSTLLAVVVASKVAYTQLWKRGPVTDAIEFATTPGSHFLK